MFYGPNSKPNPPNKVNKNLLKQAIRGRVARAAGARGILP